MSSCPILRVPVFSYPVGDQVFPNNWAAVNGGAANGGFRVVFPSLPEFRGPRMGGWIRRGWIWRFWSAPVFRPEVPKPFKTSILGPLDWKSGRPKNAKFNHDVSNPPFSALWRISLFRPFSDYFFSTLDLGKVFILDGPGVRNANRSDSRTSIRENRF